MISRFWHSAGWCGLVLIAAGISQPATGNETGTRDVLSAWRQWGGPQRDFTVPARLDASWSGTGPLELWRRELGPGYSGVLAEGARLFTMYRDGEDEVVIAMDRENGRTAWEHRYPAVVQPGHSLDTSYGEGPNSTPLLADGRLYSLGFTGIVRCLDAGTGARKWSHDLREEYDQPLPYFGHASSPIRHQNSIIVVAGDIYAFDVETGALQWRQNGITGSYASPVLLGRGSRTILIVAGAGEVAGLDPSTGKVLWREEHANTHRTILSSPAFGGDDWVLVSAYFLGSIGLQLSADGQTAMKRWETPHLQVSHTTTVRLGDLVYGFHNSILTAINIKTGVIEWRQRGLGRGNLLLAGDRLLLLDHLGKLSLLSPGANEVHVDAQAQVLKERTWTAPTLVDRTLYIRTQSRLVALDLQRSAGTPALAGEVHRRDPREGPPRGLKDTIEKLQAALYAADGKALAGLEKALAPWTGGDWAPAAFYFMGVASWQRIALAPEAERPALLDEAVEHLLAAVRLRSAFAEAHALLAQLYQLYYHLAPRRAAIIGPKGQEHLGLAMLHGPENPRVRAAQGMILFHRPEEYGGDQLQGLELLRQALQLFQRESPGENSPLTSWGEALTWRWYGAALLGQSEPDRTGAREAFQRALALRPEFKEAQEQIADLEERDPGWASQ